MCLLKILLCFREAKLRETLTRGAKATSKFSKDKGSQKSHSKRTGTDQSRRSNDVS